MSDMYQRKITRARRALEHADTVRSITKQLDKALNYQKNMTLSGSVKFAKGKFGHSKAFAVLLFHTVAGFFYTFPLV